MTDTGGTELTDHVLDTPYVDRQGWRTALCSCGARFTAPSLDDLEGVLVEHVDKPLHEATTQSELLCVGCTRPTTFKAWPLCDACKRLQSAHVGERRLPHPTPLVDSPGATTLTVLVALSTFATVGVALRYGGWVRLLVVCVAVALLALGLRLDARPKVRR